MQFFTISYCVGEVKGGVGMSLAYMQHVLWVATLTVDYKIVLPDAPDSP